MQHLGLLATLAVGLSVALAFGFITQKLKLSPILGYLLAGVAIGPYTPGFVGDANLAAQMAEVGVILLMFGVGLHFHIKDLLAVKSIAIPGAVVQSLFATALGAFVAHAWGWGWFAGAVLGIAVSVASTVVLMRVLMDNNALDTPHGHIAVGWLIVEDIFTVLVLVLLPIGAATLHGNGGSSSPLTTIGFALLKLVVLAVLVLFFGGRLIPALLHKIAQTRSRELFTLAVLALALAIATGPAAFFGASVALGAFLAGIVVGQSRVSHQAAADALPMRDAFAVLFFVSVGMLFDPRFLLREPGLVAAVLAIVLLAKPLIAFALVLFLGYSVRTALTVGIGLAQIGEFSFILAEAARKLGVLPEDGQGLLVACALISISLNPLLFRAGGALERWLQGRRGIWQMLNRRAEKGGQYSNTQVFERLTESNEKGRAIIVGYGPVGQTVSRILESFEIRPVIIEMNVDTVKRLSDAGKSAIYGDAGKLEILQAAGVERARFLVVTLPDLAGRIPVIISARELNPAIRILVRARYLAERSMLEEVQATSVCYEEVEAAVGLSNLLLREVGAEDVRIKDETERIRNEFALSPATSGL